MSDNEEWRPCHASADYSVSNLGRVRRDTRKRGARAGHVVATWNSENGYPKVFLSINKKRVGFNLHALVARAFCDKPDVPGLVVNHINGDKRDPRSANLEWVTQTENQRHALRTGLRVPVVKLSVHDVIEIRARALAGERQTKIARDFDVTRSTVSDIKTGKRRRTAA